MYCPGEKCSKRDTCANHINGEGQLIDWSRQGSGAGGIDKNGNYYSCHKTDCGDNGTYGYRKYKNSEGTICAEECLHCPHVDLCFQILELAGMIVKHSEHVRFDCEEIKADPENHKQWIEHKINERKQGKF